MNRCIMYHTYVYIKAQIPVCKTLWTLLKTAAYECSVNSPYILVIMLLYKVLCIIVSHIGGEMTTFRNLRCIYF